MFDAKKAAEEIISADEQPGEANEVTMMDGGKQAFFDAMDSFKKGDKNASYDAFRAAVVACMNDDEGDEGEF